jgi:hypothetical protein
VVAADIGCAGELQNIVASARAAASTMESAKAEVSAASAAMTQAASLAAGGDAAGAAAAAAGAAQASAAVTAALQPHQHPLKELAVQLYRTVVEGVDRGVQAVLPLVQSEVPSLVRRRAMFLELLQVKIQHTYLQITDSIAVRARGSGGVSGAG